MYEIWLVINILWEIALGIWPLLLAAAVAWALLAQWVGRRPDAQWRSALVTAMVVGLLVAVAAAAMIPGWSRASISDMGYWVDWATRRGQDHGQTAGMIPEALALAAGLLGARALVHQVIVRGLRAPRMPHGLAPHELPVASGRVQAVDLPGPGGRRLAAWLALPPGTASGRVPAVLAMHGWGSNLAMMWPVAPPLLAAGYAVLLVDARCHGHSDGESFTSLPRFAEDIAAGLAWLRLQPGIDPQRLALIGHSVGAAAALLHAAHHDDVRAVISLSAFAHPHEVMRRWMVEKQVPYPVLGWYVLRHVQGVIGVRFDAIAPVHTITRVRCPVLLVHGLGDTTVPLEGARRLHAASGTARLLTVEGDHDLRQALERHGHQMVEFLALAMGNGRDKPSP